MLCISHYTTQAFIYLSHCLLYFLFPATSYTKLCLVAFHYPVFPNPVHVFCCFSHVPLFATSWTVACQAPLSLGILQARILEWVAMPFSRGSSQPQNGTQIPCIAGKFFTVRATSRKIIAIWGTSLSVWKLSLCAPNAGGTGLILGGGTNIPHAVAIT